jgi:hypothetical protein
MHGPVSQHPGRLKKWNGETLIWQTVRLVRTAQFYSHVSSSHARPAASSTVHVRFGAELAVLAAKMTIRN